LEAIEFVRVAPIDEEVMVPAAPDVSADDVRAYPGWSAADEDQQRMWALVGTMSRHAVRWLWARPVS
jgi:hypothetical protein